MPPVVASIGSVLTAISSFTIAGIAVGSIALNLAGSLILSAVAQRLTRGNQRATLSQQDIKRELAQPKSRPAKRFIYGRVKAPGTPAPLRVDGDVLYMCLILNSRPSAGSPTIYFDNREAQVDSGDMLDFTGPGATLAPVEAGQSFGEGTDRPRVWLGLGGQTTAPDEIVSDLGGEVLATDGWRGLTVLWVRIPVGPNDTRVDRWPRTPPVIEVEADWSKVWDPRDEAQDPDDPATWTYSNNQALCLLDAILQNPIKRRPRFLVDVDAFSDAADLADESVARFYAGGTAPRYTTNGILIWSTGELVDQISPLAEAGGGDLVQIGGQISYAPPVTLSPSYTIDDILEDGGLEFTRLVPGSDLPTAVRASYIAPDRGWQESDIPALAVGSGATQDVEDGIVSLPLSFVTEATQAMRVQKIVRNRLAAQRRLSVTLPPDAIDLTPGAVAAWGISELPKCNGNWRVQSISPSAWLQGDGVALRCPVQLAEEPASVDAWDPEADEFELATETYTPPAPVRVAPTDLTATTGPGVAIGDTPRIRFSFEPVAGNVVGYEWQWRETGGEYAEGGSISASVADSLDRPFGYLTPVVPGTEYQIQVRTLYLGALSDFTSVTITAQGPAYDLDPPSDGQAIGGAGQIEVSFLTPNNVAFEEIEFWGSDTDDSGAAVLLTTIASAANTVRTIAETGLGASETRFYFARSRGPFGSVSAFSASVSATTDP